jgi:uncharacterized protein
LHYVLLYEVVNDYITKRAKFREAHLKLLRQAFDRGEIVLAGAFTEPVDEAMVIFRGDSPAAAENFVNNDPYMKNGLVTSWRVRKWMTVIGDGIEQ